MTSAVRATTEHLLIVHGSPDPRHARTMGRLADEINDRGVQCDVAYLEHDTPTVSLWLSTHEGDVSATGLLLAPGYHAQVDVPQLLAGAPPHCHVTDNGPIGVGPWLTATLEDLVAGAGGTTDSNVIVIAAGSTRADARSYLREFSSAWALTRMGPVTFAVSGTGLPAARPAQNASPPSTLVLPLMIAPGVLSDRVRAQADDAGFTVTGVLTDSTLFIDAVVRQLRSYRVNATSRDSAR